MRRESIAILMTALVISVSMSALSGAQPPNSAPVPAPPVPNAAPGIDDSGTEVLMRGPVHEAFAEPVNMMATPTPSVPKRPPDPIDEVPPDVRPDEENAVWIGGYWAWDDESQGFLWVSGVWRVPPMGQQWVPGYWTETAEGYRWVPGFWTPADSEQIVYYPQPPESLEQGPVGNPPTADSIWIPGTWVWRDGRYAWQAGYWGLAHAGLTWVPACYVWSPNGWVFSQGYWDYPLADRGVLFAPVRFTTAVYLRPSFRLIPGVVVDPEALHFHLFVRPNYYHYYFGDYYAPRYETAGIYPWFEVRRHQRYHYDPLFWYSHWYYRQRNPRWIDQWRDWHRHYREHADWRPPHTFAALRQELARGGQRRDDHRFRSLAASIQDLRRDPQAFVRFTPLTAEQRESLDRRTRELSQFRRQRTELEARATAGAGAPGAKPTPGARELNAPRKLALPRLPGLEPRERGTPRTAARPIRPPEGDAGETRDRGEPKTRSDALPGIMPKPGASPGPGGVPRVTPKPELAPLPGAREPGGERSGRRGESPLPDTAPKPQRAPLPGSPGYHPELQRRRPDLPSRTTPGPGSGLSRGIPGIDAGRPGSGTNLPSGVVPRIGEPRTPPMPGARTPQAAQSPPPATPFPGSLMPRGTPSNTDLVPRRGHESPLVPRTLPQTRPVPDNRPGGATLAPPATGRVPGMDAGTRQIPEIPRLGRRPDSSPGAGRMEPPRQATPRGAAGPSREPPGGGRGAPDRDRERPEKG